MLNIVFVFCSALLLVFIFSKLLKKYRFISLYFSTIFWLSILFVFIITIVTDPKASLNAAREGINLCINVVVPSLFPFFVGTELLTNLGFVHIIGTLLEPIMRPIFNVHGNGSFAFSMGIISGYPVGAKTTVDLYKKNFITKTEAERLLPFCNNSGPLFILGAVATGMFHQPSLGYLLFLSHLLAALTVGVCFRFYKMSKKERNHYLNTSKNQNPVKEVLYQIKDSRKKDGRNFGELFGDAIKNAINLSLRISGFIVFFSVLIQLLTNLRMIDYLAEILAVFLTPMGISKELMPALASGFFEITTGIKIAASVANIPLIQKLVVTSLMLGWAGLSVHSQVISILGNTELSVSPYILGKGLQGLLSFIYTYLLIRYTPFSTMVSSMLEYKPTPNWSLNIINSFSYSATYLINVILFLLITCVLIILIHILKHSKKTIQNKYFRN